MIGRKKNIPWGANSLGKRKYNKTNIGDVLSNTTENPFVSTSFSKGAHQEIIQFLEGGNNKTPEKKPGFLGSISSTIGSIIARSFLNKEYAGRTKKTKNIKEAKNSQ